MKISRKIVGKHLCFIAVLIAVSLFWKCPDKLFLGIPCPGCGLTRAHLAALRLDFGAAFRYHPLFPTALPALFYLIHRNILPVRLPNWAEWVLGAGLLAAFLGVYGYRMLYDPVFRAEGGVSLLGLIIK